MPVIKDLKGEEILDQGVTLTIRAFCTLESGKIGIASIPSGASTGAHEACELRDNDVNKSGGKGVLKAIENINLEIAQNVIGKDLTQNSLDEMLIGLDGTDNKSRLGANAILAVSLAFARAESNEKEIELFKHLANLYWGKNEIRKFTIPEPAFNIINGGKHSDSGLAFQEFMIIPVGFQTIKEKVHVATEITSMLKNLLIENNQIIDLGDEGGFAPKLSFNNEALTYLKKAISGASYNTDQVKIAIDVAATTFFKDGYYVLENKKLNKEEMISMYQELCSKHAIISIEDGLSEEDFDGFAEMNKNLGDKINIVGDDLTVTNIKLIKKALEKKAINTLLIKPNQIGTLSETLQAIKMAKDNNIKIFISHRSGETEDTFIADLAVAVNADYIKSGAPTKKERMAKYNRLIEIENNL